MRIRENLKIEQNLIQSELYFRVVFRGWECSHSIRSEILLRNRCPDFFQLFQKYFREKNPKNILKVFGSIEKKTFEKSWKMFRTSISKQNFTADRMGALSASENHSKA